MNANAPPLSIIVPTYNRRERLLRLLRSLAEEHARGAAFEVVVAIDGSTDGTAEALAGFAAPYPLIVLAGANRGPAAARNRAVAAARGAQLLFLDDDVIAAPGLVARHAAGAASDDRAVTIGPMLPPPRARLAPWLRWEAETLQKQYDAMLAGVYAPTPRQFYTGNAALARALFDAAGGFNESYRRGEDVEFARRLEATGARFVFVPEAIVWHEPDRSFSDWLRVAYAYGTHDARASEPLATALAEWPERHPLNRCAARLAIGHRLRRMAIEAPLRALALAPLPGLAGARRHACSALFTIRYWQGAADTTGLGPAIWRASASRTTGTLAEEKGLP